MAPRATQGVLKQISQGITLDIASSTSSGRNWGHGLTVVRLSGKTNHFGRDVNTGAYIDYWATAMPNGKCLFLDFDGVLHPSFGRPGDFFGRMPLLEAALREVEVDIVISSSWRFHHAWADLLQRFPPSLKGRVRGCTGEPVTGSLARWHEIRQYRERHGVIGDRRALDDSAFEFPKGCAELVLCDAKTGMTGRDVQVLRRWALAN